MKLNNYLLTILSLLTTNILFAQTLTEKSYNDNLTRNRALLVGAGTGQPDQQKKSDSMSDAERKLFYELYIPSIISKSGMAPADFDNFGFSFGDDKVNFSTGLGKINNKNLFGLQATAEAPNGASTLFKPGTKGYDFGLSFKYTHKNEGKTWYVVDPSRPPASPRVISSQRSCWWNISYTNDLASLNVFTNDTTFVTKREYTYELLFSFNGVFNSLYFKKYKAERFTWSLGLGLTRFTNYKTLDEITIRKGVYYEDSKILSETDNTNGRIGPLKISTGAIFRGAVYKPITDPFGYTNVYLGVTANYYGIGSSNKILNSNFGVYFSKRHADTQKNELMEDFSIGLIADWKNLQKSKTEEYWKKNFRVILSAQIPLRFD